MLVAGPLCMPLSVCVPVYVCACVCARVFTCAQTRYGANREGHGRFDGPSSEVCRQWLFFLSFFSIPPKTCC